MTITAALSADIRARASYLPLCPLCSHVAVRDCADILNGPTHREFQGRHKLDQCCLLSAGCPPMESAADVAKWWRQRRLEPLKDLATDNRRRNCLAKLAAANLEAIK